MSNLVDELAKVLHEETDYDNSPDPSQCQRYARAVVDSGLVVSKSRLEADVEYWRTIADARYEDRKVSLEKAYAERDEALAEANRWTNAATENARKANRYLARAEKAESAVELVRKLADQPTVILSRSGLNMRYENIRRAIEGGGDDD